MYKEYSALTQNDAVAEMYQEMAGRHRARFSSIHIIKVVELMGDLKTKVLRATNKQFLDSKIAFPLPHRQPTVNKKGNKKKVLANRPTTFKA